MSTEPEKPDAAAEPPPPRPRFSMQTKISGLAFLAMLILTIVLLVMDKV